MSDVVPVTFLNKEGYRLFGMFHRPVFMDEAKPVIILLSPGVKTRVAPHRLYNKMTERFVGLGYAVLRFDFYGLGDSEGEVHEEFLADLYGSIQVGRYVGDTVAAMDWVQEMYGTSQFIASGLCGGALTGLLTAAQDSRICCVLGLSIPVILDGSHIDFSRYMTDRQLKGNRDRYVGKLLDPGAWRSWVRFFTFRSHYSLIARSIFRPIFAKFRQGSVSPDSSQNQERDNTNPYFAPAFRRVVSSSRYVYLIFAETDRLCWEFEKKFAERHRAELKAYGERYDIHITPQANHIFSFGAWESDMLNQCSKLLQRLESKILPAATRSQSGAT